MSGSPEAHAAPSGRVSPAATGTATRPRRTNASGLLWLAPDAPMNPQPARLTDSATTATDPAATDTTVRNTRADRDT